MVCISKNEIFPFKKYILKEKIENHIKGKIYTKLFISRILKFLIILLSLRVAMMTNNKGWKASGTMPNRFSVIINKHYYN